MTHQANRNQDVPGTTLWVVRRAAASVAVCCFLLACGSGSSKSKSDSEHPETNAGLLQLVRDIVKETKAGKTRLAESLQLDDHRSWFVEHFGSDLGKTLAADYDKVVQSIDQIGPAIKKFVDDGFTKVVVERFDKPELPDSVVYQHLALKKMTSKRTSLYSVRLLKKNSTRGFHLWSFVYSGGGFRWVGKMTGVADGPDGSKDHDKNELRMRERDQAKAQ